jgi:hypothetical protein
MNVLNINIGLNNNPLNAEQIKQMFYKNNLFKFILFEVAKGEYTNNYEDTLIIEGETKQTPEQIESYIFILCTLLTQECIPFTFEELLSKEQRQINKLVYNKNYNGLKQEFNKDYFLTIGNNTNN